MLIERLAKETTGRGAPVRILQDFFSLSLFFFFFCGRDHKSACIIRCLLPQAFRGLFARSLSDSTNLIDVVNIRVGTPEQDVRVIVSTASPESFVVLSDYGCSTSVFDSVPANCAVSRGQLFNPNQSSTWHELGLFGINENGVGLEANLGYSQRSDFATESLGLGLTGPSLENQTVAGIATAEPFYLYAICSNPPYSRKAGKC